MLLQIAVTFIVIINEARSCYGGGAIFLYTGRMKEFGVGKQDETDFS